MSDALRSEVRAYQLCKVDDTWAEAAHRDVSRFFLVRDRSQLPYAAASYRLSQTLSAVDAMTPAELMHFHQCMRRYKAIGQTDVARSLALRGLKCSGRAIADQVYRSGSVGLENWSAVLGSAAQLAICDDDARRQRLSSRDNLLVEYLESVIPDGEALSLPMGIEHASLADAMDSPEQRFV